ncbi:MAG: twin-arginine translocase TatA/TatE family subunit [Opitutaceae bacterium]|nr:twin-arginine translocase TatA/TatE family subunit [Opitutaceae bacterium]
MPLAFGLGSTELIVIFLVILLLFGGAKLPSLARGLGQSIREFKKASNEAGQDEEAEAKGKTGAPKETPVAKSDENKNA